VDGEDPAIDPKLGVDGEDPAIDPTRGEDLAFDPGLGY